RCLKVHGGGVPSARGGEPGGKFAGALWRDVGAGTGLGNGVAEGSDPAGFGMDGDGDLLLVERFKIARHPDLHGTVALEERGGGGEGEALQEVLAGERIGGLPMGHGEGDVLEGGGGEALRLEEGVGGAGPIAGEPVIGRFAEAGDGNGEAGESEREQGGGGPAQAGAERTVREGGGRHRVAGGRGGGLRGRLGV